MFKIVYLINGLGPGGAEMMLYRLLQGINRDLFDPAVIVLLDLEGPIKKEIENIGIPVYVIGFKTKFSPLRALKLYRLIQELSPDILHTQLFASDIMGRMFGNMLRVPIVITSIRNSYYGSRLRDLLIKWTEKFSMKTTIVSKAAAKRFIEKKIIPAEKLQVIYNGIDPNSFIYEANEYMKNELRSKAGLPISHFLLLAVGSLSTQKGYRYLLEAMRMLQKNNSSIALVIAGTGSLKEKLKAKSAEFDLNDRISFIGRSDNVPGLMSVADTLILSSLWEGLPGVVLEAMASGLPVIATAVGGSPELLEDGVTGYLVPPGSSQALAEAIEKMFLLPDDKRRAMGHMGRKRVVEGFHVKKMIEAYENLYFSCLEEKTLSEGRC